MYVLNDAIFVDQEKSATGGRFVFADDAVFAAHFMSVVGKQVLFQTELGGEAFVALDRIG